MPNGEVKWYFYDSDLDEVIDTVEEIWPEVRCDAETMRWTEYGQDGLVDARKAIERHIRDYLMRIQAPIYRTSDGRVPFAEWYDKIQDLTLQSRIDKRLERMANGNFGDHRSVGVGVFELRFHFGAGYRIYFAEVGNAIVLLLCGGDKASQTRDIERAKEYWSQYKETQRWKN